MTPFLGQIMAVAFNFAPRGYLPCDGRLLPINTYQALFALFGTTYGGDGRVNFAIPDLRGRIPVCPGAVHQWGEKGGEEAHTLVQPEVPAHTHAFHASTDSASGPTGQASPLGNALGQNGIYATGPIDTPMLQSAVNSVGNGQAHENRQPFAVINWVVAIQGIFPSQT